jgi:hypothetical protein
MTASVETAIVGAGPYGLSIAAHLHTRGASFQIFGVPMQTWREHMPKGMLLKSDGFASNLSDPAAAFTLEAYCASSGTVYDDTRIPVQLATFIDYGLAFQKSMVPQLDPHQVTAIERNPEGFLLTLEDGERVSARRVVLAVGITHFAYIPPDLAALPPELLSHSSAHRDTGVFRGRSVAVIGAGASAVDLAALLNESGADVRLVARRARIDFHDPPGTKPRTMLQRMRHPTTGLGPGWKSRLYTDAPRLFRQLPEEVRLRIVREHLGPAPGWPMRERVVGKVRMNLGVSQLRAERAVDKVRLTFLMPEGRVEECLVDHVISATGYKVDLSRLTFLSDELRRGIRQVASSPVLSSEFESSVPGLYFVGIAAANCFGPMMRFAFGADYTAGRLSRRLIKSSRSSALPRTLAHIS